MESPKSTVFANVKTQHLILLVVVHSIVTLSVDGVPISPDPAYSPSWSNFGGFVKSTYIDSKDENISNSPIKILVYPWNNHLGRAGTVEWNANDRSCKEIPQRWQGKVRSINTNGSCVVLYSRHNCDGSKRIVKIGSASHHRLSDLCFQRKPLSVRPCDENES